MNKKEQNKNRNGRLVENFVYFLLKLDDRWCIEKIQHQLSITNWNVWEMASRRMWSII